MLAAASSSSLGRALHQIVAGLVSHILVCLLGFEYNWSELLALWPLWREDGEEGKEEVDGQVGASLRLTTQAELIQASSSGLSAS